MRRTIALAFLTFTLGVIVGFVLPRHAEAANTSRTSDRLVEQQSRAWLALYSPNGTNQPGMVGCDPEFVYPVLDGLVPVLNNACSQYGPLWDVDGIADWQTSADLAAGESIVITERMILDNQQHLITISGSAQQNRNVIAAFAIPERGYSVMVPAGQTACLLTPSLDLASLPEIANSNGGHGELVTITWTLTATKKARGANLYGRVRFASLGWQQGLGCTSVAQVPS